MKAENSHPLVSVCVPTYNGAAFLQDALDSINAQTYSNIEIVVSDDASTDATLEILKTFSTSFPIRIIAHTPNGIGANWNHCLENANGDYVKFLFQDDVLYPDCISEMMDVLLGYPEVGLVSCKRTLLREEMESGAFDHFVERYGNLQEQFEKNEPISLLDRSFFKEDYFLTSPVNKIGEPSCVLFRKEAVTAHNRFDEELKQILDYVFYYRLLKRHSIAIINTPLVGFRLHGEQATVVNTQNKVDEQLAFEKILYTEFLSLLNEKTQERLKNKFSLVRRIQKKLKKMFK